LVTQMFTLDMGVLKKWPLFLLPFHCIL
jgi:hypothetical protein